MSENKISIKPANHCIYQCPQEKKVLLLNKLIAEHKDSNILVVCSSDADILKESIENKNIEVVSDKELVKNKELFCDFLISYDMPIKAIVYIARVSRAKNQATMLLNQSEQKGTHLVEALLGRAIKQEAIEGFCYERVEKPKQDESRRKKLTKEAITEIAKKRYTDATKDEKTQEMQVKWAKKEKAPNKFLGKDENGKAIFSGKSGDRNHRHDGSSKDAYNVPKKVGKKINIQERKPKES